METVDNKITALVPHENNSRTHSSEQIRQIAASITEFGFTNPILVDEKNAVIAGHGRISAAKTLNMDTVPCVVVKGLTEAQKKAYVIADNKLALNAGWDTDLLSTVLMELKDLDFDLALTGFNVDELADLLNVEQEGLTDPDDVPDVPDAPISVTGDVWTLGNHRLMCGDSTSADDVGTLLGAVKPHLMVTDPPYGVNYSAGWRNEAMPKKNDPSRWRDGAGRATGAVENDDNADWSEAWALFPGDVFYVWHAGNKAHIVAESLLASGYDIRAQIIWAKSHFAISRGDYHPMHEPCWYGVRKGKKGHYIGGRKQTTVWQIDKPQKSETGHSTQKPVECMKRPIENNSSPGQAIYEPFSGSGTTIIAGEMTGRHIYAMEISPAYVDVAVRRWEEFTGTKAEKADASGET
jgi:DNA modification methylase